MTLALNANDGLYGLAIWGVCFLMALVYLLASLRTFRAIRRETTADAEDYTARHSKEATR